MYDTKATCLECDGEGCHHCHDEGECDCDECVSVAAEAAWERRYEDFHGGSGPLSLDEQHRRAWEQKQELRR